MLEMLINLEFPVFIFKLMIFVLDVTVMFTENLGFPRGRNSFFRMKLNIINALHVENGKILLLMPRTPGCIATYNYALSVVACFFTQNHLWRLHYGDYILCPEHRNWFWEMS